MTTSSRARSSGPILPATSVFRRSTSPSSRFCSSGSDSATAEAATSTFASSTSSFSSGSTGFFHRSASPTYINLYGSTPMASSVRFSIDRSISQSRSIAVPRRDQMGSVHERGVFFPHADCVFVETSRDAGNTFRVRSWSRSKAGLGSPSEPDNNSACRGDKTCGTLQKGNGDTGDDVSETSMVDSMSGLDITPDDVVGIIGQKHFWKARRAIVNQQRVFAVQVFELHKLIKVQRLIAGSPHLLVDESAYLGKPSLKSSPAKKLPLEFAVKPPPNMVKHKDDSERTSHQLECSAENAVGKTPLPSVKNGNPPSNYGPYMGNPLPVPAPADGKGGGGPWCYPQPPGHQWLVPVMTPSEGLVYKPYPGVGFMSTVCGGCGPMGPAPMTGSFINPAYGVQASHHHHHHQGIGYHPGTTPPIGHGYFPPYGVSVMNHPTISGSAVEQRNRFSGQLSGGGASFNMQHQNSCNLPTQKRAAIPHGVKFPVSKDSEFQGSTASSPSEREKVGTGDAGEGRDPLPLFPTAPAAALPSPGDPHPHGGGGADQPTTRVIRVVPHNARSATESAARIFQSIQDERKQLDST